MSLPISEWWGSIVFGVYVVIFASILTNLALLLRKSLQVLPLCFAATLLMYYYAVLTVSFTVTNQNVVVYLYQFALPGHEVALVMLALAVHVLSRRVKLPGSSSWSCWALIICTSSLVLAFTLAVEILSDLSPQTDPTPHWFHEPDPYKPSLLMASRWIAPTFICSYAIYIGAMLRWNSLWYKRKYVWYGIFSGAAILLLFQGVPHGVALVGQGVGEVVLIVSLALAEGIYRIERIQFKERRRAKTIVARESNAADWGLGEAITPMSEFFSRTPRGMSLLEDDDLNLRNPLTAADSLNEFNKKMVELSTVNAPAVEGLADLEDAWGISPECQYHRVYGGGDVDTPSSRAGSSMSLLGNKFEALPSKQRKESITVLRGGSMALVNINELDDGDGI